MTLLLLFLSCKSTPVYIYPDIAILPGHEKPFLINPILTKVNPEDKFSDLLISCEDADIIHDYIISLREYAQLLEADIKFYVNVTRQPSD